MDEISAGERVSVEYEGDDSNEGGDDHECERVRDTNENMSYTAITTCLMNTVMERLQGVPG